MPNLRELLGAARADAADELHRLAERVEVRRPDRRCCADTAGGCRAAPVRSTDALDQRAAALDRARAAPAAPSRRTRRARRRALRGRARLAAAACAPALRRAPQAGGSAAGACRGFGRRTRRGSPAAPHRGEEVVERVIAARSAPAGAGHETAADAATRSRRPATPAGPQRGSPRTARTRSQYAARSLRTAMVVLQRRTP